MTSRRAVRPNEVRHSERNEESLFDVSALSSE